MTLRYVRLYDGPYDPAKGPQHMPVEDGGVLDIVTRLRISAEYAAVDHAQAAESERQMLLTAIEEIERLRARVKELELALHLAAADFAEAKRVAQLCLDNVRTVLPDSRAGGERG